MALHPRLPLPPRLDFQRGVEHELTHLLDVGTGLQRTEERQRRNEVAVRFTDAQQCLGPGGAARFQVDDRLIDQFERAAVDSLSQQPLRSDPGLGISSVGGCGSAHPPLRCLRAARMAESASRNMSRALAPGPHPRNAEADTGVNRGQFQSGSAGWGRHGAAQRWASMSHSSSGTPVERTANSSPRRRAVKQSGPGVQRGDGHRASTSRSPSRCPKASMTSEGCRFPRR